MLLGALVTIAATAALSGPLAKVAQQDGRVDPGRPAQERPRTSAGQTRSGA